MAQSALGLIALFFIRAMAWGYGILPLPLRQALGSALGRALLAAGFRRSVVDQNLLIAYPEGHEEERKRVLQEFYPHLGRLFLEILLLFGPFRRHAEKHGELRGKEHWERARTQGKGVVFLASHVGNWEMMAATGALNGMDLMLVTKHLKPEWLHRAIERGRLESGVSATYEPRTFRDVLTQLKRGETVGIVLDQYAGPPVGIRVPVFGVPVGTQTALAVIVKRTGSVVLPVKNHRQPDGRFVVEIEAPLEWVGDSDPNREIALNTANYAQVIERHVREHPGQWLWTHRRFKGDLSPLRPEEWLAGRARR